MVLDQRQQHHQDMLEVKCSGPPRPALLELRVCVCVEEGTGSSYLCAKKPSGGSGEFRPTEVILRNKAMKTGRGLFFPLGVVPTWCHLESIVALQLKDLNGLFAI